MPLKIGEEAPDFELDSHLGHKVRVSSFRNIKNVVVFFEAATPEVKYLNTFLTPPT